VNPQLPILTSANPCGGFFLTGGFLLRIPGQAGRDSEIIPVSIPK